MLVRTIWEQRVAETNKRNLLRLDDADLDRRIYRIYALDHFKELLAARVDAVVNPTKWQDPFENFFLERTEVMDDLTGSTIPLKNLAVDWYGQCWSMNKDTDAMWRIYCPDPVANPGVKVRTTIRKLFDNLKGSGSPAPYLQFFIGKVEYRSERGIVNLMRGLTFTDIAVGGQGDRFADLLCLKRTAFRHEREVRLLFQDGEFGSSRRGVGGVFKFALDPSAVFEEVVLDPRMKDPDAAALKADLLAGGRTTLPISRSNLYRVPHFVIPAV
jgi:hypothetical protein